MKFYRRVGLILTVWVYITLHMIAWISHIEIRDRDEYPVRNVMKDCSPCSCGDGLFRYVEGGVLPEFGKRHHEPCIWPRIRDSRDRVLPQMDLIMDETSKEPKYYNIYARNVPASRFEDHKCPVQACRIVPSIHDADLVFLRQGTTSASIRELKEKKAGGPITVWYMLESPKHSGSLSELNNLVNWTATYRRDSVVNTPYERFTYFKNYTGYLPQPKRNFATNKTKSVAAFISNCNDHNGRLDYVKELSNYISVDIYGHCGNLTCNKGNEQCKEMLRRDYKFYLAFENSNCRDYITEKLYWNALLNDVLPVVMGAAPEDYRQVAPPSSYIHVDDFNSPKELAEYLSQLEQHDHLYNQYFRWQGVGAYIDTKFWCRLCAMLHEAKRTGAKVWYDDVDAWWDGEGVCIMPDKLPWSTWNNRQTLSKPENHTLNVVL